MLGADFVRKNVKKSASTRNCPQVCISGTLIERQEPLFTWVGNARSCPQAQLAGMLL